MRTSIGAVRPSTRFRRFFQQISRSVKLPFAFVSREAQSHSCMPAKTLNCCDSDESLDSTLVRDDFEKPKTCFINLSIDKEIIISKIQCVPGSSIECCAYDALLSPPHPERDADDVIGILNHFLHTSPCSCPIHKSQSFLHELCLLSRSSNVFVNETALCLIVLEIRNGNTSPLVEVLLSCETIDLSALLQDLMSSLPEYWLETQRADRRRTLQSVWSLDLDSNATRRAHAAMPFVEFCHQLILSRESVARSVVDAGYIEMIIKMCKTNFPDSRIPTADTSRWNATSSLTTLFTLTLQQLSRYSNIQALMASKFNACQANAPFILCRMVSDLLKPDLCRSESYDKIQQLSGALSKITQKDCVDILRLTRRGVNDTDTIKASIELLLRVIVRDRTTWVYLRDDIMRTPYQIIADLFFDIIHLVLSYRIRSSEVSRCFVGFVNYLSEESSVMRTAWEEGGIGVFEFTNPWVVPVVSHSRRNSIQELDDDLARSLENMS